MAQSGFRLWKIVLTIALAFLFFAAFTAIASAATIYVPDDQGTIQNAVNAASPGDIPSSCAMALTTRRLSKKLKK